VAPDCSCPSISFQVVVFRSFFPGNFLFTDRSRASTEIVFSLYIALLHSVIISLSEMWKFNGIYIGCPTTYQTRNFFNNSKTNEDIATKQTHTTDTFLFISHTTNVILFKSRCNIFIGFRIIKEMPGLVGSGTPCTSAYACVGLILCCGMPAVYCVNSDVSEEINASL